jgi:Putative porin
MEWPWCREAPVSPPKELIMTCRIWLLVVFCSVHLGRAATGLDWIDHNTNLTFYGDLRLRYEVDWDSQTAGGLPRDDRNRGRIRARAGFNYRFGELWSTGARVRTGSGRSQQSPHLTFVTDDGARDGLDFVADRYFVQFQKDGFSAWGGRNTIPFWQQNELFWDEDVTPTGLAGILDREFGPGALRAAAGAFYVPDGGWDLNGQMVAGQVKYALPVERSQVNVAGGIHYLHGQDGATNLRNRNGARDYLIGVGSVQWQFPLGKLPLSLGSDVFYNFLDYDAADVLPFPASDTDQRLGYVFSAYLGQLKHKHDWLIGYSYTHIETFSVNGSYAQDDWIRFGSGAQTDSSDFKGHEIRLGYAISSRMNLLARLYLVDAITTVQDGKRFRLDFNWKF